MAWFGEAQHAANPPPYLTLWRIPIQYIWTHAESRSHGHHVMMTHVFVPYTEYTHKYNHAGIKTWGKWLQKQHICNPAGMASHRTMASEPSPYHNLLHPLHWALHVIQAQTSYINACLIFATQNHGNSLPHDAGCESNAHQMHIKCHIECHIECHTATQIIAGIHSSMYGTACVHLNRHG